MGCEKSESPTPSAAPRPLRFVERVTVPVTPEDEAVVSLQLLNTSRRDLRVVSITPQADDQLSVRYVGYSTCKNGCSGAGVLDEETKALVEKGLEGTLPIDVPGIDKLESEERKPYFLIFALAAKPGNGALALKQRCLRVHAAMITLADGTRMKMAEPDGSWIAGIHLPEPLPSGYRDCSES